MASEWVAVAGTAIGASIGGVVTVASMIVKGRQDADARQEVTAREDRLRQDDRAWTVKLHNLEQRRELYARLLRSAAELGPAIQALLWPNQPADKQKQAEGVAQSHFDAFGEVTAEIEVIAVDRSVIEAASEFRDTAYGIYVDAFFDMFSNNSTSRGVGRRGHDQPVPSGGEPVAAPGPPGSGCGDRLGSQIQ
jgi:hypothetical protein